jgi:hypothetical protein
LNYPAQRELAKTAAPFLLKINSVDNGKQLTAPVLVSNDYSVKFFANFSISVAMVLTSE